MGSFQPAVKKQAKLGLALSGPSGSGKTYTALAVACALGERVAVIDTEHGSASLYADRFRFDVCRLESYEPQRYIDAMREAADAGYHVIVIDSLSHAWAGKGGLLEQVDNTARRTQNKNTYFAWRDATPQHNAMIDAIVGSKAHVLATMRSKTEYVVDTNEKGKTQPRKVGTAPIQRDGMEYEFSVAGELDLDHFLNITKTRCPALVGASIRYPGADLAKQLLAWLDAGEPDVPGSSDTERDAMRSRVLGTKTLAELEALVPDIKKLSEIDREAVKPDFGRRKAELAQAAPKKAEPAIPLSTKAIAARDALAAAGTSAEMDAVDMNGLTDAERATLTPLLKAAADRVKRNIAPTTPPPVA